MWTQYFTCILLILPAFAHDYHYEYMDYSADQLERFQKKAKERLVNAAESRKNEFPFAGAYFMTDKESMIPTCTASLISPSFAVTAAHCFFQRSQVKAEDCNGKSVLGEKGKFRANVICEILPSGDAKMWIADKRVHWYLLFGAVNAVRDNGHIEGMVHDIEYFIRHKDSKDAAICPGGQDIGLIKLKKQNLRSMPICLPGPKFQDTLIKSKLVGFGKFERELCLTNTQGPMKNHYCQISPTCKKNCRPQFKIHNDKVIRECNMGPSPAEYSRLCEKVTINGGITFKADIDEIHLFQFPREQGGQGGRFLETCYRKEGERGWCRTEGNNYDNDNPVHNQQVGEKLTTDYGWGFCSKDCEVIFGKTPNGRLRKVPDADVFDDETCQKFVDIYMKSKGDCDHEINAVRPEALCIGRMRPLSFQGAWTFDDPLGNETKWGELDREFFDQNPQVTKEIYRRNKMDINEKGYYTSSVGSCNGDSGGPVFQDGDYNGTMRLTLTGITSGGLTSTNAGSCGGVNNPTLYARMRGAMTNWVLKLINGTEETCVVDQVFNFKETAKNQNNYYKYYRMNVTIPSTEHAQFRDAVHESNSKN